MSPRGHEDAATIGGGASAGNTPTKSEAEKTSAVEDDGQVPSKRRKTIDGSQSEAPSKAASKPGILKDLQGVKKPGRLHSSVQRLCFLVQARRHGQQKQLLLQGQEQA